MSLSITKISNTFSTSPQITEDDVAEIEALGFKTFINKRPMVKARQISQAARLLRPPLIRVG